MQVERHVVQATTDASGNATVFTPPTTGRVLAIHWIKPGAGGITGAAFAVTSEDTGEPILSVSAISASQSWYPRGPVHTTAGVAQLYAAAGLPVTDRIGVAHDRIKIAVSGGGNTLTGTFHVVIG